MISTSTPTGAVRGVHLSPVAPLTQEAHVRYCIRRARVTTFNIAYTNNINNERENATNNFLDFNKNNINCTYSPGHEFRQINIIFNKYFSI